MRIRANGLAMLATEHLRWDVLSRELDKLSVLCIWNVSVVFELVACWMLRELASKGVCGRV